ncbi:MAG: outer membrane protein assembly factor BamD [Candidatus Omnitrophota bacterium]|nr:MAG: outer membrane protein assembly factor BamD [Candidatus Omnitrophota bacterium]
MKRFFCFVLMVASCVFVFTSRATCQTNKESESFFVASKAFDDGFYEVSLSLLGRFLSSYPNTSKLPEAKILIGRCFFQLGKYLEALKQFEELLKLPGIGLFKDEVYYWIAEIHFRGNDFPKASAYYKKVADEFPRSRFVAASYYSLGWCLFQEQNFAQALDYFKLVADQFPGQAQAQDASFKMIECLFNLKEYEKLKKHIATYQSLYPQDKSKKPYLFFYQAEADYYLNNFDEAIKSYSFALENTTDVKIKDLSKLSTGWAYLKLKNYEKAKEVFSGIQKNNLESKNADILILGQAIAAFETKQFEEAKKMYEALIQSTFDPMVLLQAYLGKADVWYGLNDYKNAIQCYKEALSKIGDVAVANDITDKLYYGLAWSYLKEGEFKEAINNFRKIAQSTQDSIVKISALCQIGDAYQDSGDYGRAKETYDNLLKEFPESFYTDYVQYQLGLTMLKSSDYDGAIMSFMALKKNFPNSKLLDDASYALGLAYFQRKDYTASRENFEKFLDEFKDSDLRPQALYLSGTSLFNLGKYQEAIEAFKGVTKAYTHDEELIQKAEYEIADCYYQMGDEKEAMARFTILRAKYPDSKLTAEIMWWLGEYYYRHNDLALARRYFSSLVRDFPASNLIADSYYALGSIENEVGNYKVAIDYFKKVIELNVSDLSGQAAIAIADIYTKENNTQAAIETYQKILKEYPNLIGLIYPKLADTQFKAGNYEEALALYQKSREIVPLKEMTYIQFKIAEALQVQGKIDLAIEEYLKVPYLFPEKQELVVKSYLRVAKLYEDSEKYKEAVSIYKKIESMDIEESKFASEMIEKIKAHQ